MGNDIVERRDADDRDAVALAYLLRSGPSTRAALPAVQCDDTSHPNSMSNPMSAATRARA